MFARSASSLRPAKTLQPRLDQVDRGAAPRLEAGPSNHPRAQAIGRSAAKGWRGNGAAIAAGAAAIGVRAFGIGRRESRAVGGAFRRQGALVERRSAGLFRGFALGAADG